MPLPPMVQILHVDIKSKEVLWDALPDSLGHMYDHACYDTNGIRKRKQSDIVNLPIKGKINGVDERVAFNKEENCESCFQKYATIVELRIKGDTIYCPYCNVRRPNKWNKI